MSTKPDYEAAAKELAGWRGGYAWQRLEKAKVIVDAALGGDPTAFAVVALIAEGGEIVEAVKQLHDMKFRWLVATDEPGRYLLYGPIPVESAEAKETPDSRDTGEKP